MPYNIRKKGDRWILVDRKTNVPHKNGDTIVRYDTRDDALAASRAIMANE